MVIFTDHALLKLKQRRIAKSIVLLTLKNPDVEQSSYGKRHIRYKKFRKLTMSVVFVLEGRHVVVVTAHWVEKIGQTEYHRRYEN